MPQMDDWVPITIVSKRSSCITEERERERERERGGEREGEREIKITTLFKYYFTCSKHRCRQNQELTLQPQLPQRSRPRSGQPSIPPISQPLPPSVAVLTPRYLRDWRRGRGSGVRCQQTVPSAVCGPITPTEYLNRSNYH